MINLYKEDDYFERFSDFEESIRKTHAFLFTEHGYEFAYLQAYERFPWSCVFGIQSIGLPRFQFRREYGVSIEVGPPDSIFSTELHVDGVRMWWPLSQILDFVTTQSDPWLGFKPEIPPQDEALRELATSIEINIMELFQMFKDQAAVSAWATDFDKYVKKAVDRQLRRK